MNRKSTSIALLLLAFLAAGCNGDAAPADDRETGDAGPAAEAHEEGEAPEFEPLDGRFTVDTARAPGTAP